MSTHVSLLIEDMLGALDRFTVAVCDLREEIDSTLDAVTELRCALVKVRAALDDGRRPS